MMTLFKPSTFKLAPRSREGELLMYAILRTDLGLTPSQYAVQSAHAILDAWTQAPHQSRLDYRDDGPGSKVALGIADEGSLCALMRELRQNKINCAMTIEGPPCPEQLLNTPIAIGVGPVRRADAKQFLGGLRLLR